MGEKGFMRISELESKAGVPKTSIHFYVRIGVLHPPVKTGRTMAYYDESHLKTLESIQKIKSSGRVSLSFLKESIAKLEQRDDEPGDSLESQLREIARTTKAKDRKKQEILKAAIRVFSEKGYRKIKVRDITSSLGISTGTFYIYFKDKQELFVDVVDYVIRTILGDATEAIRQEDDIVKRMVIRGRVFYDNYSKYNEILNQLRAEMVGEEQWPHDKVKKAYHALTKPVIRDIQKGIEEGIYRNVDPDLTAYTLTGIIEMMCFRTIIDSQYNYEQIEEFVLDFITNGLQAKNNSAEGDSKK
ncbi:MAG: TetR family transcriptional regulator [Syntrophobacteraceae bacterium]